MCVRGNPDFTVVRAPSWAKWCCCCSIKLFLGFFLAVTWGWSWSLTTDVLHLATDFSDAPKDGKSSRRALGKTPGPGVTVDVLLEMHKYRDRSPALGLRADLGWAGLGTVPVDCWRAIGKGIIWGQRPTVTEMGDISYLLGRLWRVT